jgi:hypothetical protein
MPEEDAALPQGWPANVIDQLSRTIFEKYDARRAGVLRQKEYEAYCIAIYFCLELTTDEWNEQCNGLGVKPSEGIDLATVWAHPRLLSALSVFHREPFLYGALV